MKNIRTTMKAYTKYNNRIFFLAGIEYKKGINSKEINTIKTDVEVKLPELLEWQKVTGQFVVPKLSTDESEALDISKQEYKNLKLYFFKGIKKYTK